jgi:hypothetical protein
LHTDPNVLQRYQQSMTTSERDYQSTETLDEALRTPWALHYEIQRRPATPNFSCNSTEGKLIKTSIDTYRERDVGGRLFFSFDG